MPATSPRLVPLHAARPAARPMTAEDLWALPRVGAPRPAPDGAACVVPVSTWDPEANETRTRLWWVPVAGGEPRPLTAPDRSATSPAISPDGRQLAFTRKESAGRAQVFVMPLDGGEARRLTDLPLGAFDPRWLPDGSGLVFAAQLVSGHLAPEATRLELERREKDPVQAHVTEDRFYRYWDTWLTTGEVVHLFHLDLAGGAIRDLTPESAFWFDWMEPSGQFDIAPDGREIAFAGIRFDTPRSLILSAVYTVPLAGGPVVCRTPDHRGNALSPRYTKDGRSIVIGLQDDPLFYADRVRLARLDRGAGAPEAWLDDWALSPAAWEVTPGGGLMIVAEDNARMRLHAWNGSGSPRAISTDGAVTGLSMAAGRAFFTRQTLAAPAEVYACAADGSGLARLTRFTDEVTARFATGEVRELEFEGAKGERVQMYVVLPVGYAEGRAYPLVHVIHGGPHGISGDQFHARWNAQLFAAPGYVVAMVNFQGSTSWGQDFAQRIQGEWAARPFEDVMKATDALIAAGLVDSSRMAAAGGSYGGYMAAWIAGHTDRFRCIVNHAGVADLMGQYASDVTQGRGRATGGEAWKDLDRQDLWSPVRFASGMSTPMLVIHGERDYRVPVGQGLLMYGLLKAKGVPARLVYFPDENHWVLKAKNSLLWYREVHAWLERWLGA